MLPEQCRAARAWLGWSMDDLAGKANVSNSTIRDFEAGRREPHRNRLAVMRQALEAAGIIFTGKPSDDTAGIAGKTRGESPRAVIVVEKERRPTAKRKPVRRKERA